MSKPIIHLWSIAGSDRNIARQLGLRSTPQLVGLVQDAVGPDYKVTANVKLFEAKVDARRGGRSDDAARARDIERALADDRIAAIVSVRGGAWLARVLPHVNFDVLKKRKTVVHVFGFSELTALINIVARYPKVRAHYDMGPGFAMWGLRSYAMANYDELSRSSGVHTRTESARAGARGSAENVATFAPCRSFTVYEWTPRHELGCGPIVNRFLLPRKGQDAVAEFCQDRRCLPHIVQFLQRRTDQQVVLAIDVFGVVVCLAHCL